MTAHWAWSSCPSWLARDGKVQKVTVVRGDKGDPGLNSAAVNAVSQWRYKPFVLNGIPVPVKTTVVVRFPRDAFVPQSVNQKNKIGSQIRNKLEGALKELERVKSRKAGTDMGKLRRRLENARKELERAKSRKAGTEMRKLRRRLENARKELERAKSWKAGTEMKKLRRRLERAQKELERAKNETAVIDMKEFRRKLRELEEMIERGK